MGVRKGTSLRTAAVCGIAVGGKAAPERIRRAEPGQHGMGIRISGCGRGAFVFVIGQGSATAPGALHCAGPGEHSMSIRDVRFLQ